MRTRRVTQRGDRGAVLIVVAAFSIVAVILMAAVIDLGNQRQEKKQVTLSTDAAALAAAQSIDFSDPHATGSDVDCGIVDSIDTGFATVQDVATEYWNDNGGAGTPSCEIFFHATSRGTAYVTVDATQTVDYALSGATGKTSGTVDGSSSALVSTAAGGNLYPVAMCGAEAADAVGEDESVVYDPPVEISFVFTNAECGGSGNFRQVQFDPTRTGNQCGGEGMWCYDFNHGGYPGAPQFVESDTGTNWQQAEEGIVPLVEDGTHIWIVAAEYVSGSGTSAVYEVTHFVEVVITEYRGNHGMDFDLYQIVPYDSAGPPPMTNASPVPAHLCATGQGTAACQFTATPPEGEGPGVIDILDPCETTTPTISPSTPSQSGNSSNLSSDLVVTVPVNDTDSCSASITMTATRLADGATRDAACCNPVSGPALTGTFDKQSFWSDGNYRISIAVDGTEAWTIDFTL